MSLSERPKFLSVIIIALMLLNFGTLSYLWLQRGELAHHGPGMEHRPHGEGGGPGDFIIRELKFSDEQRHQFEHLRDEHHGQMVALDDSIRELQSQFFHLLQADILDSVKVGEISNAIAAKERMRQVITVKHFAQVKSICDTEQKKKFDNIIEEILRMMGPLPPPAKRP